MKAIHLMFLLAVSAVGFLAAALPQETPKITHRVDPVYPAILKQAGIEGDVYVVVTINDEGQIEKIDASRATDERFVPAALEAIRQWKFSPATKGGVPVKAEVTIPIKFRLGPDSYKSGHEELFQLKADVENFLRGQSQDSLARLVDPEAYIVFETDFEPLLPLVKDKKKSTRLVEGKDTKFEFSRLRTDADMKACFLVLKTQPVKSNSPRFHTVVFMKDSSGNWKIEAWHVSHG
jgi:protein TonB